LAKVATGEIKQITQGQVRDQLPRWSPDGKFIVFLRTKDKDTQFYSILLEGGEARQLTHLEEGSIGAFALSPDGRMICFEFRQTHPDWTRQAQKFRQEKNLSDPPRVIKHFQYRYDGLGFLDLNQQIWTCEIGNGKSKPVTDGEWDTRDPVWSPDGSSIAFFSNRSDDPDSKPFEEDIWVVPFEGGPLEKVSSPPGYKQGLSWSPSGAYFAYIGSETRDDPWGARNNRIWIVPWMHGKSRCLTTNLNRITENVSLSDLRGTGNQTPTWTSDSKSLFFLVSDRGNCHLYSVNLQSETELVVGGNIDITGFSMSSASKKCAILASKCYEPTEVFITNLDSSDKPTSISPVTQVNKVLLKEIQFALPEEIWFKSYDDTDIQGWLLKPPYFEHEIRYPLVLYIHGGPAAQYANTFFHEFQVLAAQGYVILITNPRGSLGREEDFATCIQGNWGDLDFQDLMAAVDFVEKLPFIDSERMAVIGGSYGGFMVTWMIGHTDRFRCAITERGVSNRHSAIGTTDNPPMPDGYWSGNIWDRPKRLWQQSPLRLAGNIHTPLLIIHSEGDLRCPIGQAEQLYSALKRLKCEVTFLRYPVETSHGLSRNGPPDLRLDRLERIKNWLDQYLK
jgi:acylaminoacyl-peptidase